VEHLLEKGHLKQTGGKSHREVEKSGTRGGGKETGEDSAAAEKGTKNLRRVSPTFWKYGQVRK